jgi:hypothetical protein
MKHLENVQEASLSSAVAERPVEKDDSVNSSESDVQVIYGASVQFLPLVGVTIAQARLLVETILGVDPTSPVLVNGRPVRARHTIARGEALEFIHHAGEKGRKEEGPEKWTCASRSSETGSSAARTARLHFRRR